MGLHLIPNTLNIDFVGIRRISYILSILLILAGVVSFAVKGGPRYGIDFAGGTIAQVKFAQPVQEQALKDALSASGKLRLGGFALDFERPSRPSDFVELSVVTRDGKLLR